MWVRLNGPDFPIMFPISIAIAVLADSGTLGLGVALGLAETADGVALDCATSFRVVRGLAALVFSQPLECGPTDCDRVTVSVHRHLLELRWHDLVLSFGR